jgi:hypothetical protein
MITTADLHWAAGFLEGEGCFVCPRNRITGKASGLAVKCAQVQKQPVARLLTLFGGSLRRHVPSQKNHQPYYTWHASGALGAGVMMTLLILMSPRRKMQIKKALREWYKRAMRRGKYHERWDNYHSSFQKK